MFFKSQYICRLSIKVTKLRPYIISISRRAGVEETSMPTNPIFGSNNPDFPEPITQVYTTLYRIYYYFSLSLSLHFQKLYQMLLSKI